LSDTRKVDTGNVISALVRKGHVISAGVDLFSQIATAPSGRIYLGYSSSSLCIARETIATPNNVETGRHKIVH
jgi:hypothetical protein